MNMKFKNLLFLAFLLFAFAAKINAQTYYSVTALSGTQTVNGVNVTVTANGSTASPQTNCGVSPYRTTVGGYKFVFSSPVYAIRSHMSAVNSGDTIQISFNGSTYTVTSSNLTAFAGNCSSPLANTPISYNGIICGIICGAQACVQFDAQPGYGIDSVWINETTSNCGGIIFDFSFANNCPGAATALATPDTLCANDTLHLFCDTTAVSTTATFAWTGPNGFSSTARNPVLNNVSTLDSGLYSVVVTDTGVCAYASSVNVVVNPSPVVNASSNSPLCPGDTLKLFSTTAANTSYSWTGPNGFFSSSQNPVRNPFMIADSGTYHLHATMNGCTTTVGTHIALNTLPVPVITYNSPLCPGDTLKLYATSAVTGVSYSWTGPNGFSSSLQNPVVPNVQTVNAGNYSVTVTNGCSGSTTSLIAINPVLGPPAINISVSPKDTICAGANITLTAVANNAGNAPTFQWQKNGANIAGATSAIFTTGSVSNGDLLTCIVTSNAPCQAVNTNTSTAIHMHVISIPPPAVSVTTYPPYYSAGDTVTFTGHVPNGSTGLSYQWMKNGVIIPGATTIFYTSSNFVPGDSICLIVHSSIPCTFPDSTITCVQLTTGVDNLVHGTNHFDVFPNPNNGSFTISGKVFGSNEAVVEIVNTLGQIIYKETVVIDHTILNTQVRVNKVPAGIYTLLIKTENEINITKLLINL